MRIFAWMAAGVAVTTAALIGACSDDTTATGAGPTGTGGAGNVGNTGGAGNSGNVGNTGGAGNAGNTGGSAGAQPAWDSIDRALVAVSIEDGTVHLGWRLSAHDDPEIGFDVFRRTGADAWVKCNDAPVTTTTDFVDTPPGDPDDYSWFVQPVVGDSAGPASNVAQLAPGHSNPPYLTIPMQGDYQVNRAAVADLDGDGTLDWVIEQPIGNIDPVEGWAPSTDTYKLEAYANDGTFLWRIDRGWSIETGVWYAPYLVHDLDGDGMAEVILKTGEGDPRDLDGRVTTGPEYLTILDGRTGAEITHTDWPTRDGFSSYGLVNRNQLAIAYLDGVTPHVIVERGTYGLQKVVAYRLEASSLVEVWRWDNAEASAEYQGQGAHWLLSADLDDDQRDEVVLGSLVLDDDGAPLWTTGLGHPDLIYLGDLDPERPGWEIFYGIETPQPSANGMCMVDASTGEILWGYEGATTHIHYGACADYLASEPGTECWSGERDGSQVWMWSAAGELLSTEMPSAPYDSTAYWNDDRQREILTEPDQIRTYDGEILASQYYSAKVLLVADIVGDWREQIVVTPTLPLGRLRIYTTPIAARDRHPWLMQDPIYGMNVRESTSGYRQEPMTSFDLQSLP